MNTISVREMKANWSEIERQVARGEIFEVLNRGKPAARIVPARPRKVLKWDDHLATALPDAFISYDERQRNLATRMDLPVLPTVL